jgi:hypothetical protein
LPFVEANPILSSLALSSVHRAAGGTRTRGGTLAYLAAWDVHHANLFDRVEKKTGIEPFDRLVEQVMSSELAEGSSGGG